jgi:hypothetical protein
MRILIPALAGLFGVFASISAQATTLVHLSLEQLSQASSEIVRGRVIGQEARWNSSHTRILTFTTIEIERTLKGTPRHLMVIEQPGGSMGNIRVRVAGTVSFRAGSSYFLFLEPTDANASGHRLVGMAQGAYRIYRHPQTHEERVIRPFGGLFHGSRRKRWRSTPYARTISAREFLRKVSAALAAPLVIPSGTSIPVAIRSSDGRGGGKVHVSARTTATVYPNRSVVVPVGSSLEGSARLVSRTWKIHWSRVSIQGKRLEISASSEEPVDGPLRGRVILVNVR